MSPRIRLLVESRACIDEFREGLTLADIDRDSVAGEPVLGSLVEPEPIVARELDSVCLGLFT